ncbi:universal stress protein [Streptoalloteichus hindustanus]|uniref:Nucleotide-binding universal stress protein, UspA family n=1 Tax=Streptoalloteichus hindustanus TaxID=2017 RepID=A0A1M4Z018_STRHI|nr:universal stress protein [Streptoalloteichus hindustanus]SHF11423.1 Nucleotide-binding universal stress protein, UspA family [Streptoalloteichus hindustanus]
MTSENVGHPVAVGVGDDPADQEVVRWAAEEAARRGVGLRLVHGYVVLPYTMDQYVPDSDTMARRAGEAVLDAATATARSACPGLEVSMSLTYGTPDLVLAQESVNAALVVVGTHPHSALTETVFGSTAGALVRDAPCPIVAVPRGSAGPERIGPVVAGVDGSPASQAALAFAFDAASRRGLPLRVAHYWYGELTDVERAEAREDHHVLLAESLAGFRERHPDVSVSFVARAADPVRELRAESAEACLLVLGTHGRGRLVSALLGSVSRDLVRTARCPVAVVRPQTDSPEPQTPARHHSK